VFVPQFAAVRDLLRVHQLGISLDDLAAAIALRVIIITWTQVRHALAVTAPPPDGEPGPDDGGFW